MKLVTKELEKEFKKYPIGSQEGLGDEAKVLVKYFNPCGAGYNSPVNAAQGGPKPHRNIEGRKQHETKSKRQAPDKRLCQMVPSQRIRLPRRIHRQQPTWEHGHRTPLSGGGAH